MKNEDGTSYIASQIERVAWMAFIDRPPPRHPVHEDEGTQVRVPACHQDPMRASSAVTDHTDFSAAQIFA